MLQLQKAQSGDTCEADYLRIIFSKTASLFEAAALAAAISVNSSPDFEEAVRQYAVSLGIAFQIRDDIFDYSGNTGVGKPVGVDILEQKITMPLLGAFENSTMDEELQIRKMVSEIHEHPEYAGQILDFVAEKNGMEYAEKRLGDYVNGALAAISRLPETRAGEYLGEMTYYVAKRDK